MQQKNRDLMVGLAAGVASFAITMVVLDDPEPASPPPAAVTSTTESTDG